MTGCLIPWNGGEKRNEERIILTFRYENSNMNVGFDK